MGFSEIVKANTITDIWWVGYGSGDARIYSEQLKKENIGAPDNPTICALTCSEDYSIGCECKVEIKGTGWFHWLADDPTCATYMATYKNDAKNDCWEGFRNNDHQRKRAGNWFKQSKYCQSCGNIPNGYAKCFVSVLGHRCEVEVEFQKIFR